jgi:hypothetical protein
MVEGFNGSRLEALVERTISLGSLQIGDAGRV